MTAAGEQNIALGAQLGNAGGEGVVRAVVGLPHLAAKIYYPDKRARRRDKIVAMVKAGFHQKSQLVAFPISILADDRNEFIGFTMRRLDGHRPVHELYGMEDRWIHFPQAAFPFLVRTAENVARAVSSVHDTGCVVGDISHSNILISAKATAALVDSDSFQVVTGGRTFFSGVGTMEFLPPELHGQNLDMQLRTENHDLFSLAVVIFQILFLGRHPFHGRFRGAGESDAARAIREFRFAYSNQRKAETLMEPPPGAPLLEDLFEPVADAFERAFSPAGVQGGRPSARHWAALLEAMEKDLVRCKANETRHHHSSCAPACPWCRVERELKRAVFPLSPAAIAGPTDPGAGPLKDLLNAIETVPEPEEAADLDRLIAAEASGRLSPPARRRARTRRIRLAVRIGLVAAGLAYVLAYAAMPLEAQGGWIATLRREGFVWLVSGIVLMLHRRGAQPMRAFAACFAAWAWSIAAAILFHPLVGVTNVVAVGLFFLPDIGRVWRIGLAAGLGVAVACSLAGSLEGRAFGLAVAGIAGMLGVAVRAKQEKHPEKVSQTLARAEKTWLAAVSRWRKRADKARFLALKAELRKAADRLAELARAEPGLHALSDRGERRRRLLESAHERSSLEARLRQGPEELRKAAAEIDAKRQMVERAHRALLQARADLDA